MIALALRLLLAGLAGAIANRARGSALFAGLPHGSRFLKLAIFAAVDAGLLWLASWPLLAVVAFAAAEAGWSSLGWGARIDLGRNAQGWQDGREVTDWLLDRLVGPELPGAAFAARWRRDALGLLIYGLGLALAPLAALLAVAPWAGLPPAAIALYVLIGPALPLAYELGYRALARGVVLPAWIEAPAPLSEALFGFLRVAMLAALVFV